MSISNYGLAINQALLGYGVALGWAGVIAEFIEKGALIPLDFPHYKSEKGYYLVARESFFTTEICKEFITKLKV